MDGNLVLSRKESQSVTLFKDGEQIAVIQCRNRDVLVINADESVKVVRTELLEREAA